MSKPHFLVQAGVSLLGGGPGIPPERWIQAFPDGRWADWPSLVNTLGADDGVWVPTARPDWEVRVAALLQQHPGRRVVVVSGVLQDAEGLRALQAGARGYCHQLALPAVYREVEQAVRHGGLWVGPDLVQRLMAATRSALDRSPRAPLPPVDLSKLSDREAQVARLVAAGKSNKEVADQLFISERTVKAHLGAVFDKLGVRDRVQLVLHLTDRA